ncbi:MAG: replication initiator protein A, partial [Oricola sp.]|nr:replication initiator protein A [Oricola sp.]
RDYRRLRAALDRLQSTTVATTLRQPPSNPRNRNEPASDTRTTGRRMHRFSWINEWTERADAFGNPDGIELIVPDWFYKAVLDEALVLTIDRAYFGLTGGIERWLYRIVRKHGGRQKRGWRFDFRHLYAKSGSLSPFKRFAFELRAIIQRQPLPGYTLFLEIEAGGRTLLAFEPAPCGQAVEAVVLSGTRTIVPSGTDPSCYREPKPHLTSSAQSENRLPNLESNKESNFCRGGHSGENLSPTGRKEEKRGRPTAFTARDDDAVSKSDPARTGEGGAS